MAMKSLSSVIGDQDPSLLMLPTEHHASCNDRIGGDVAFLREGHYLLAYRIMISGINQHGEETHQY